MIPFAGGIKTVGAAIGGGIASLSVSGVVAETAITDNTTVTLTLVGAVVVAAFYVGVTVTRMSMRISNLEKSNKSIIAAIKARHHGCPQCGQIIEDGDQPDEEES